MSDTRSSLPHFLRVTRALARVRGVAAPLAITTVVAGTYCACDSGSTALSGSTTGSGGYGGHENGIIPMDGGYGGGAVGDMVMPDAGSDSGLMTGISVMPDAGSDGG